MKKGATSKEADWNGVEDAEKKARATRKFGREYRDQRSLVFFDESGEKHIEVLRGVDFQLKSGQSASIQGESGSGKSTLLNLLAGLDLPDGGDVLWEGQSIAGRSGDALSILRGSQIGMVFQSYYLVPELRALDNVMLGGRI